MTTITTKGCLKVTEGSLSGQKLDFLFNPSRYAIRKSNAWSRQRTAALNVEDPTFAGGEGRVVALELYFDGYLAKDENGATIGDVRPMTDKLFKFMEIDSSLKGSNSQLGRPPKCQVEWGQDTSNHFVCFLERCSVEFLMFDPSNGKPVRAKAQVTLKEATDSANQGATNPTSVGEPGQRVWRVTEGDRLDWIAFQEYGDAAEWRRIALANGLINPLDLRPGTVLSIPPR